MNFLLKISAIEAFIESICGKVEGKTMQTEDTDIEQEYGHFVDIESGKLFDSPEFDDFRRTEKSWGLHISVLIGVLNAVIAILVVIQLCYRHGFQRTILS